MSIETSQRRKRRSWLVTRANSSKPGAPHVWAAVNLELPRVHFQWNVKPSSRSNNLFIYKVLEIVWNIMRHRISLLQPNFDSSRICTWLSMKYPGQQSVYQLLFTNNNNYNNYYIIIINNKIIISSSSTTVVSSRVNYLFILFFFLLCSPSFLEIFQILIIILIILAYSYNWL